MSGLARKILIGVLIFLLVLSILLVVLIPYNITRSFPQTNGELQVPGLQAPVDVYRDAYGVPHIYASNSHDLFFTQGYVHAQDRFWQMDFWRHIGSGRLAEMFGESCAPWGSPGWPRKSWIPSMPLAERFWIHTLPG
jgi:penicillin amidase